MTYYEYAHKPGYGRDDHMADEIITRAACYLGIPGASNHLLACCHYISHPVMYGASAVRIPAAPGVRRKMTAALNRAYQFMRDHKLARDTWIEVQCVRVRRTKAAQTNREGTLTEIRYGRHWVTKSITWDD